MATVVTAPWSWQPGSTVRIYVGLGDKRDTEAPLHEAADGSASATGVAEVALPSAHRGTSISPGQAVRAEGTGIDGSPRAVTAYVEAS